MLNQVSVACGDRFAVEPSILHFLVVLCRKKSLDADFFLLENVLRLRVLGAIYPLAGKWGPRHLLSPRCIYNIYIYTHNIAR